MSKGKIYLQLKKLVGLMVCGKGLFYIHSALNSTKSDTNKQINKQKYILYRSLETELNNLRTFQYYFYYFIIHTRLLNTYQSMLSFRYLCYI